MAFVAWHIPPPTLQLAASTTAAATPPDSGSECNKKVGMRKVFTMSLLVERQIAILKTPTL